MGDEDKPQADPKPESENKKFIKITVQQMVAGFISLVLLGILTFFGTTIMGNIQDTKDHETRLVKLETWKEEALLEALNNLGSSIDEFKKSTSTQIGTFSGEQKKILSEIAKIQGILEEMRRDR
jgi:hypothetical protein